jgi:hypothetical protein
VTTETPRLVKYVASKLDLRGKENTSENKDVRGTVSAEKETKIK